MKLEKRKLIMRDSLAVGLLTALVGISMSGIAAELPSSEAAVAAASRKEADARRQVLEKLDKKLESVRALRDKQDYPAADKAYQDLLIEFQKLPGNVAQRRIDTLEREMDEMRAAWANTILYRAQIAAAEHRYVDAISIASEAQLVDPGKNDQVSRFIEYCRNRESGDKALADASLATADAGNAKRNAEITGLLREAQTAMKAERYDEARIRLEKVFLLNPFNAEAIEQMAVLYHKLYEAGFNRRRADVTGILAAGEWQWAEPVFPADIGREGVQVADVKTVSNQSVFAKMERIVFPTIEFDGADIISVIRFLNSRSKVYDPDKEGVNIVAGFDKDTVDTLNKVTMSFARIPMSEVLRYICQDLDLKYRVDANGIFIGTNVDDMQVQYIQVRGDLISGITGQDGEGGDGGIGGTGGIGGAAGVASNKENSKSTGKLGEGTEAKTFLDDRSSAGTAGKTSPTSVALMRYFEERGVQFAEGASIAYDRRAGKLIVRNTVENLRRLDELIRQLDAIETPLVLVEIKGIEISETDYQELGFEWTMDYIGSNMDSDGNLIDDTSSGWGFQQGPDRLKNLRSYSFSTATNTQLVNNWNIFASLFGGNRNLFGSDVPLNINLSINALSQNTHNETLAAPKVMTKSGIRAEVRMVKSYRFPESWDTYEIEENDGSVTITAPVPEFADESDIGIIFDVTPTVNPDNNTINLNVNPTVTNYLGKDSYSVTVKGILTTMKQVDQYNPVTGAFTGTKTTPVEKETTTTFDVWMPMISRRNLQVNVTVYDGETIVLGGMIDATTITRLDKWPLLGDLPLVGRFFQSRAEDKQQNNLLLFVTTRLVTTDGVPIRRNLRRGAPDFNR